MRLFSFGQKLSLEFQIELNQEWQFSNLIFPKI